MASIRRYRAKWLRWHKSYEKQALKLIEATVRSWTANIRFEDMTDLNYSDLIRTAIDTNTMFDTYQTIYTAIGTKHGERVGEAMNKEIKFFSRNVFMSDFLKEVQAFLLSEGSIRITLLENTYFDLINNLITQGIEEGKTIREVARDIQILVNRRNFYRWRAMRIARTETTTAANMAAAQACSSSIFEMQKLWISAQDNRTRRTPPDKFDHLHMNGVKVDCGKDFEVSGEEMAYPGAPTGSAGNVINCRCTVAVVPKRDRNGNLIMKD